MERFRSAVRAHYDLALSLVLCAVWNASYLARRGGGIADWTKELFYFAHAQAALRAGHFPGPFAPLPAALAAVNYPAMRSTTSYWANPEVFTLSPFLPLLRVMSLPAFIKLVLVAHSAIGCLGVVMLGRRLGLHPVFRLTLVALTALNPWVMQHYAIGYTPHVNLLLCPWIVYLLLDPARRVGSAVGAAAIAALMLYQGGLHVFVWTMLSAGLVTAAIILVQRWEARRAVAFNLGFVAATALLAAPKLYATLHAYRSFRRGVPHGLLVIDDLIGVLADPSPIEPFVDRYSTCFWDGSIYMGWWFIVVAALGLASAFHRVRASWGSPSTPVVRQVVVLGAVAVAWLSCGWGTNWADLAAVIRPLDSEIYPYRFIFLALLFVIAVVVIELNALFLETGRPRRWLLALALVPVAVFGQAHYALHSRAATSVDAGPMIRGYEQHFATVARPR